MTSRLFTIGFTKKTAEEFFRLLQDARVKRLIDIRERRDGQLSGFAKFPDLAFFLQRLLGIEYNYEPLFAPSPEIRTAYRQTRDWQQYEKSFLELMEKRKVLDQIDPAKFKGNVALLCSEAGPEKCHRRLVAEMLSKQWNTPGNNVLIHHLIVDKLASPRKRKAKWHGRADPL